MKYGNQHSVVKSFYEWCVENNRMDLNERFDEEKNKCTSKDVGCKSNQKWWFKCPRQLHDSEEYYMSFVTNNPNRKLKCRKCNSVAQVVIDKFGESYLNDHWHPDNEISPWEIPANSTKYEAIIQCTKVEYHVYNQVAASFTKGIGCPYCINRKVHPNDSIGVIFPDIINRWSDKNNKSPYEYSAHSEQEVWLKCPNGKHEDYQQRLSNAFIYEYRCPECSKEEYINKPEDLTGQHFGRLTAKFIDTESEQSITKDGHVRTRWWCECSCGNPKLKSVLAGHLKSGKIQSCGCLYKEKWSQLQVKVTKYIEDNYDCELLHEYECNLIVKNPKTNRQLPYDNELIFSGGQKLIIEVNGASHYRADMWVIMLAEKKEISIQEALEDIQYRDKIKMDYAISQNYAYLAIPYWTEQDESYKILIDNKINEILNNTKLTINA